MASRISRKSICSLFEHRKSHLSLLLQLKQPYSFSIKPNFLRRSYSLSTKTQTETIYNTSLKYEEFYNPKPPPPNPKIPATIRTEGEKGSKYSAKKRKEGLIPAVLYGKDPASTSTQQTRILVNVPTRLIETEYRKKKYSFEANLYELELDGATYKVLPRQLTVHPVIMPLEIVSVNFLLYNPGRTKIPIPFDFVGQEESTAIKRGAMLVPINWSLTATCTDDAIPPKIEVDVSQAFVGQKIRLSDVKLPENLNPIVDPKQGDLLIAVVQGKQLDFEENGSEDTTET